MHWKGKRTGQGRYHPCVIPDSHHPNDYLALRRLGKRCEEYGVRTIWTVQDKDVLAELVRQYGADPVVLAKAQNGLVRKLGPRSLGHPPGQAEDG